ncbi:peptidase [Acetobacter orientalis]|uniref:Peptidase n=1 Tax=Acetobacter orientalis TaxID=146474 RepID=A0A2Z5ZCI6_9PROT|nr:peptidase [Acetobacter orientalis]
MWAWQTMPVPILLSMRRCRLAGSGVQENCLAGLSYKKGAGLMAFCPRRS